MELKKPFSDEQRAMFIIRNIYGTGLKYIETDDAIYAVQQNEYIEDGEIITDEDRYKSEQEQEILNNLEMYKLDLINALSAKIEYKDLKAFIEANNDLYVEWDNNAYFKRDSIIFPAIISEFKVTKKFIDNIYLNYAKGS